jgi:plasmid maintenance system antidote protein VapI
MGNGREQLAEWITRRFGEKGQPIHGQYTFAAEMLDVDRSYLSQLLAGKRGVGLSTAVKIERVTGIPVESWVPQPSGDASEAIPTTVVTD